jgi:hypothetical protein
MTNAQAACGAFRKAVPFVIMAHTVRAILLVLLQLCGADLIG